MAIYASPLYCTCSLTLTIRQVSCLSGHWHWSHYNLDMDTNGMTPPRILPPTFLRLSAFPAFQAPTITFARPNVCEWCISVEGTISTPRLLMYNSETLHRAKCVAYEIWYGFPFGASGPETALGVVPKPTPSTGVRTHFNVHSRHGTQHKSHH